MVSPYDDKVMGNPIGWLQEMCMSRRWPPPFYEMEHEEGLPHERQFTIACQVLKFREVGTGKSKKIAKRMAAHKMWQALQDMPLEGTNIQQGYEDEDDVSSTKFLCIETSRFSIYFFKPPFFWFVFTIFQIHKKKLCTELK